MFWPSAGRPHGRPSQRSVDRAVDWCAQTCTTLFGWGAGRPPDRPPESSALWIWPRSTRWSTGGELCSLYPGLGRPSGRPMAQRSEIWPLAGRSSGRPTAEKFAELSPTASFWSLFIWGYFGLFFIRFLGEFQSQFFFIYCRGFLHLF